MIETNKLNFSFGKRQVLFDLSLKVPKACIYGFLGPNGAGKTTTIKCLLGLYQVTAGMINIFGKELNAERIEILSRTGNMVEEPSLYGHLSATNNLKIIAKLRQCPFEKIPEKLELVGLTQDANRPVRQFSSGMKQRLSLAMALLSEPELLILDEPINGLDPGGIIEIRNLLQGLCETKGTTIFISSHILSEIEKLCSHVAVIHKGKLLFQGEMEHLPARQTQYMEIILETGNRDKAKELLDKHFHIQSFDHGLRMSVSNKDDIAKAIEILVMAQIPVYQVKQEINDLESAFLELIQQ